MEKFVRTVNEMEETILVPSRLLDLSVGDDTDAICQKTGKHASIKDTLSKTDLYRLYNIVNQTKVELLWSQDNSAELLADDDNQQVRSLLRPSVFLPPSLAHRTCARTTDRTFKTLIADRR